MKKKIFFFAIFVVSLISRSDAQKQASSKLKIGLKTGLSLSSFTKDVSVFDKNSPAGQYSSYVNYKKYFRIASLLGVVAQYPVTTSFSLGAEVLYAGRGAAYRQENGSVAVITNQGAEKAYNYYKFKIDYVELPLTANCNLSANSNGAINFWIYGGLSPAIAVNQKTSYHSYDNNGSSPVTNRTTEEGELKDIRTFNLSTVAGFEIAGKKEGSFFANARISNSLLPVFNQATSPENYNMKTGMWTFTLGIGIYFK